MKYEFAAGFLALGLALAPVAGYTADKAMEKSTPPAKAESKSEKVVEKAKDAIDDGVITTKIKAEYAKDKTVSMLKIHVNTDPKGVVTLSGDAKSKAEVDQAVKIAKGVKGVTEVKNEIKVAAAAPAPSKSK